MMEFLFATPWYYFVTLGLIGAVVAWTGNQRGQASTRNAGLGIIGLMVAWAVVGHFVETDLEQVHRLNNELVQAVPSQDWSKFTELLDPDVTLGTTGGTLFSNRSQLVEGAKGATERWGLQSVAVTYQSDVQDPTGITVDVTVITKQSKTEGFLPMTNSSWRFQWEKINKQWHCHQITCLKIGQENGGNVGKFIK